MQIHCADPVVVGRVSAGLAEEEMLLLVAVSLGHVPAFGTGLGGVGWIDSDHGLMVLQGFIGQLLLQIMVSPGDQDITVSDTDPLGGRADAGQVLQNEEGALGMVTDECLADAMVDIAYETVLSLTDSSQSPSGGWGLHLLQLLSQGLVVSALLLDSGAGEEGAFSFAVIGGGKKADAPVDAYDVRDIGGGDLIDLLGHGDMEEELAVLIDEPGCTEAATDIDAFGEEGNFDPSLQGANGKQSLIAGKGVVPVPDQIQLRLAKTRPDPAVLIGQDGLIPCYDRTQDRLGHLSPQAEALTDQMIQFPVERSEAKIMELEDIV